MMSTADVAMTYAYDEDTRSERVADDRWKLEITPRWSVRGYPNGGYVMAAMLRPLLAAAGKPDPLTVTAHYLRPTTPGTAELDVDVFRRGATHVHAQASLVQGSERVRMIAAFGDLEKASGTTVSRLVPPQLPPPEDCVGPDGFPQDMRDASALFDRIETRVPAATSWLPGASSTSAADSALIGGYVSTRWMRFTDGRAVDVSSVPLFVDPFPPAVYSIGGSAWIPTVELTIHVRARPVPGWLRGRFETRVIRDGYVEEDGELWDADDNLVAQARQLLLLLPPQT